MGFTDLSSQSVRHDSGAVVVGHDRYTMEYARGRTWLIGVERKAEYYFTIPDQPRWDDGTVVTEQEITDAMRIIREACARWGILARFDRGGTLT
jgi:hypothetical protein